MKHYIHLLAVIAITAFFLNGCSTKKQIAVSSNVMLIEQEIKPVQDTAYHERSYRPYYYPRLNFSFKPYRPIFIKPVRPTSKDLYEQALLDLKDMMDGKTEPNFERAVYISENPYHDGRFTYTAFQNSITEKLSIIQQLIMANDNSSTMNFDRKVNEYGRFKLSDLEYLPKESSYITKPLAIGQSLNI